MVYKIKIFLVTIIILSSTLLSYAQDSNASKSYKDTIVKEITLDKNLHSEFFYTSESSYPWYIIPNNDGTFENVLGKEITKEETVPIEHTSNCISTHQGEHVMHLCDAMLNSPGHLQLEIHGGLPAYASSLTIQIDNSKFKCLFQAVYPRPVSGLKWEILAKELKVKTRDFTKGERLYAWISVEFEETGTYQGKITKERYKIEGYIKPIIK